MSSEATSKHKEAVDALTAAGVKSMEEQIQSLEPKKHGMPDGGSYKTSMPKSTKPSWKSYQTAVLQSLGESTVAANLEDDLNDAMKVNP